MEIVKKRSIITIIGVLLILALSFAICQTIDSSMAGVANADSPVAAKGAQQESTYFDVVDGLLYDSAKKLIKTNKKVVVNNVEYDEFVYDSVKERFHRTEYGVIAKYENNYEFITDADGLWDFMNNNTASTVTGVLMNDIDYDLTELGQYTSTAVFSATLDGNGYDINITCNPTGASSSISVNENWKGTAGVGENTSISNYSGYAYTGIMCAVNQGSIINCNFIWDAPTLGAETMTTEDGKSLKYDPNSRGYSLVGGLVCGLLKNGTISNCSVTLNDAFSLGIGSAGGNHTGRCFNTAIGGGVVGYIGSNGLLERTTLNNIGGVCVVADGMKASGTKQAATVAGGLAGGIVAGDSTAKVSNCSLLGTGAVNAYVYHAPESDRNKNGGYGYSGGAIGSTYLTTADSGQTIGNVGENSINGIISNWKGGRGNSWFDNPAGTGTKEKTIAGCLFDALGDSPTISNVVILYDYINQVREGSTAEGAQYTTLDSAGNITYGSWSEIYATNANGNIKVSFDLSRTSDQVRSEIVAKNYFDTYVDISNKDITLDPARYGSNSNVYSFESSDSNTQYFIWSGEKSSIAYGEYDDDIIYTSEFIGAQIRYISNASGANIFTFGELVQVSYLDTNNSAQYLISGNGKYYDGVAINEPTLKLQRFNGDDVTVNSSSFNLNVTYTVMNGEEETNMHYQNIDSSLWYLPGKYVFSPSKSVQQGFTGAYATFAYYDAETYTAVEESSGTSYTYYINPVDAESLDSYDNPIFSVSLTSTYGTWLKSDTLSISYANTANMVDVFTYTIGSGRESDYIEFGSGVSKSMSVNAPGALKYTFNAYVTSPNELDNENTIQLLIGTTSATTYIDTVAPTINEIRYYEYDSSYDYASVDLTSQGLDALGLVKLDESDLKIWNKEEVLIVYQVLDNLSGISDMNYLGETGHQAVNNSNGQWLCYVHLTNNTPVTVEYHDELGNGVSKEFSALIDTVSIDLRNVGLMNSGTYVAYSSEMGYSPFALKFGFTPVFGPSGAYMEYSYRQDSEGNDIWVRYEGTLRSNVNNEFVFSQELDNATFKMRLVSENGLYNSVLANGDGYIQNGKQTIEGVDIQETRVYYVKIVIAYIGITLENIYDSNLEHSLAYYESQGQLADFLHKTYDGSIYGRSDLKIVLYNGDQELNETTSIIYSKNYARTAPDIEEDMVQVSVVFDDSVVGNRKVYLSVAGIENYKGKYLFYFVDKAYTDEEEIALCPTKLENIDSRVDPFNYKVKQEDFAGQIASSYVYGDDIPNQIQVAINSSVTLTLDLVSDVLPTEKDGVVTYADVKDGGYTVTAKLLDGETNYVLASDSETFNVVITPKRVSITTVIDGKSTNGTRIVYDGTYHTVSGTYVDINGNPADVDIEYYTDSKCTVRVENDTKGVKDAADYYAKLVINDDNYIVGDTRKYVAFSIVKGRLELNLDPQSMEYSFAVQSDDSSTSTTKKLAYEIKPANQSIINNNKDGSLYSDKDFTITYRELVNGIPQSTVLTTINKVGTYAVYITISGNKYFEDASYDRTEFEVTKAKTKMTVKEYSEDYDGSEHQMSLIKAGLSVESVATQSAIIKNSNNAIKYVSYASGKAVENDEYEQYLTIEYYDGTNWVDSSKAKFKDTFTNAGTYRFRLKFVGDDYFEEAEGELIFTVKKAKIDNVIVFEDMDVDFVAEDHYYAFVADTTSEAESADKPTVKTFLDNGAKLYYIHEYKQYLYEVDAEGKPINDYAEYLTKFSKPGDYEVTARVVDTNYEIEDVKATLVINKVQMRGIEQVIEDTPYVYDNQRHPALFKGFDVDENGNMIVVYRDDTDVAYIKNVYYHGSLVTVQYDEGAAPYKAGEHLGTITFRCDDYKTCELPVAVTIEAKIVKETDLDLDLLQKILDQADSSTNINDIYTVMVGVDGKNVKATFEFYDSKGNKVTLNADNTLPAGTYYADVIFESNKNYTYTGARLNITIREASASGEGDSGSGNALIVWMNTGSNKFIAIGAVAGVVIVIVGIVIGVSVSKNNKSKKKRKKKNAQAKKRAAAKDKAQF